MKINNGMKKLTTTTAGIALSIALACAETKEIKRGPYDIVVEKQGEFGEKDYKYQISVSEGGQVRFSRSSESIVQGLKLMEGVLKYDGKGLWICVLKILDGLDPNNISVIRITADGIDEAIGSYQKEDDIKRVKIDSIPKGWDREKIQSAMESVLNPKMAPIIEEKNQNIITGDNSNREDNKVNKPNISNKSIKEESTNTPNHSMEW
jgi:hypothetical protein